MTELTKAKIQLCWEIPLVILLSPLLILWHGASLVYCMIPEHIEDRLRWGRYVDDYNAKNQSREGEGAK